MASKRTTSSTNDAEPSQLRAGRTNIATATSKEAGIELAEEEKNRITLVGTGGTDLIPFLRHTRDTTKAAIW